MTNTTNKAYPVIDDAGRDSEIIGYAATAADAEALIRAHMIEAGNDTEEMAALEAAGKFIVNFRTFIDTDYDNIDAADLADGFWDNA